MALVDHRVCEIALDHCEPVPFERFAVTFHSALVGTEFVPLGGHHDGGADGFDDPIFESKAKAENFLQASKAADIGSKIRQTIIRLREFKRDPKLVTFYFSQPCATVDTLEDDIFEETGVRIRLRPKQYIVAHINHSQATQAAFNSYLQDATAFLTRLGSSGEDRPYPFAARTLCAFLGQEMERRRGNNTLLLSVVDTLILWALEGTDPQKTIFKSRDQVCETIVAALPTAKKFLMGVVDSRLQALASKSNPTGRHISWHKTNGYALHYQDRQKLIADNIEEAALESRVSDALKISFQKSFDRRHHRYVEGAVSAVHRTLQRVFETQGLALSMYALDQNDDAGAEIDARKFIEEEARKIDGFKTNSNDLGKWIAEQIRGMIYGQSHDFRSYLDRLSRTYFLLFMLKNEPQIVEFFNSMGSQLVLYVGADMIIKGLSEHYLATESQLTIRTLELIKNFGAKLIISEVALREIWTHLIAVDQEFINHYKDIEPVVDVDFASSIDRILIRAYFYSKHGLNVGQKKPAGWRTFIGQFCEYAQLRDERTLDSLRMYLSERFRMEFEPTEITKKGLDSAQLDKLRDKILERRGSSMHKRGAQILATNDALHVLRVFSKRKELSEDAVPNPFGYRTWWLTHERAVRTAAALTFAGKCPQFIMRPEFLLNYIALSPSKTAVTKSFGAIFPTMLGIRLSNRMNPAELKRALGEVRKAFEIDEHRARAKVSELLKRLPDDHHRIYEHSWSDRGDIET